jgi:hypothetical protein
MRKLIIKLSNFWDKVVADFKQEEETKPDFTPKIMTTVYPNGVRVDHKKKVNNISHDSVYGC